MKTQSFVLGAEDRRKQARGTWRRLIILMVLLLAVGVMLWQGKIKTAAPEADAAAASTASPAVTPTSTPGTAPATGRTARELAYDKDMAALQALIENSKADEAILDQAAEQLTKMTANHQTELGIEEALTKAGFDPCMVLLQNDAMTVTVSALELTATESATILAVCAAHSDVAVDNIRIMTGQP